MLRQALSSLSPVPMVVGPCSNQVILEHFSDPHCRALLQEPLSPAPAGIVDTCSCVLRCRALLLPSDRRALLRSSLSSFAPGTVKHCSGRHCQDLLLCPSCRALLQTSDRGALLQSSLSSLAPGAVEPGSGRHCRDLLLCL